MSNVLPQRREVRVLPSLWSHLTLWFALTFPWLLNLVRAAPLFKRFIKGVFTKGPQITARVATTSTEVEHTQLMRHEVYCREKGFLTEDELLDTRDQQATLINAYSGDVPVATVRVTDSKDCTLEILEMHPELAPMLPDGHYIEVSRLMVKRGFRGFRVTWPLFRAVYQEFLSKRADGLVISCAKGLIPYYRNLLGFRLLSDTPLEHQKLAGLRDYAMVLEPTRMGGLHVYQKLGLIALVGPRAYRSLRRSELPVSDR